MGTYTLSAMAYASSEYNGDNGEGPLHARFFSSSGADIGHTLGGFPNVRGVWEAVSVAFTATMAPQSLLFHLGYPLGHTAGELVMTDVQVTAPNGQDVLPDGHFPGGAHMATYSPANSYGNYVIDEACNNSRGYSPPQPP